MFAELYAIELEDKIKALTKRVSDLEEFKDSVPELIRKALVDVGVIEPAAEDE